MDRTMKLTAGSFITNRNAIIRAAGSVEAFASAHEAARQLAFLASGRSPRTQSRLRGEYGRLWAMEASMVSPSSLKQAFRMLRESVAAIRCPRDPEDDDLPEEITALEIIGQTSELAVIRS
jgi:hypothetical protein